MLCASHNPTPRAGLLKCILSPPPLRLSRTEEEDVEVTGDAKDLLTKIGVETSLRWVAECGSSAAC